jgi:DNA replication and repair protein RecF
MAQLNGRWLDEAGSQGEVRSVLLALRMAEVDLFRAATNFQPVLLIDDFSSELDGDRRRRLLNYLIESGLQVFVTSTEPSPDSRMKAFSIEQGKLVNP